MAKHVFELDCKCKDCDGTGLYVGLAENSGSAVVCYKCKGTGKGHIKLEWEDFDGRVERDDVSRVLECNPGICVRQNEEMGFSLEDFGGMSYADWQDGKPFPQKSEMRKFTCPAWWYQTADYDRKPKWDECIGIGSFSNCKHFCNREECWERWDDKFGSK